MVAEAQRGFGHPAVTVSWLSFSSMTSKPRRYHPAELEGFKGSQRASSRFMSAILVFCQGVPFIFALLLETLG